MVMRNKSFQNKLQKILKRNFEQLKCQNADYSLRDFAARIGISATAMSEILNGKRLITPKTAVKLLQSLNVDDKEREQINRLAIGKAALYEKPTTFIDLDAEQFGIISDWYHFAIMSLAETDNYNGDVKWIANRLNISEDKVEKALKNFEDLKLFHKGSDGVSRPTGVSFKMSINRLTYVKGHKDNLDLAHKHMTTNFELSDYSSMTMAIDPELIVEAKELILNFRRQMTRFLESGKQSEVYKLNIQLFPLTLGCEEDQNFTNHTAKPNLA